MKTFKEFKAQMIAEAGNPTNSVIENVGKLDSETRPSSTKNPKAPTTKNQAE